MRDDVKKVQDFHIAFGQTVNDKPTLCSFEDRLLRFRLMDEEINEYLFARTMNDKVGMLDALIDTQYVLNGSIVSHGLSERFYYDDYIDGESMQHFISEYAAASMRDNLPQIERALLGMQSALDYQFFTTGLHRVFKEAFDEVHRSNMAKLHDGKVVRRDDGKILKPEGWQPPNLKQFIAA